MNNIKNYYKENKKLDKIDEIILNFNHKTYKTPSNIKDKIKKTIKALF